MYQMRVACLFVVAVFIFKICAEPHYNCCKSWGSVYYECNKCRTIDFWISKDSKITVKLLSPAISHVCVDNGQIFKLYTKTKWQLDHMCRCGDIYQIIWNIKTVKCYAATTSSTTTRKTNVTTTRITKKTFTTNPVTTMVSTLSTKMSSTTKIPSTTTRPTVNPVTTPPSTFPYTTTVLPVPSSTTRPTVNPVTTPPSTFPYTTTVLPAILIPIGILVFVTLFVFIQCKRRRTCTSSTPTPDNPLHESTPLVVFNPAYNAAAAADADDERNTSKKKKKRSRIPMRTYNLRSKSRKETSLNK